MTVNCRFKKGSREVEFLAHLRSSLEPAVSKDRILDDFSSSAAAAGSSVVLPRRPFLPDPDKSLVISLIEASETDPESDMGVEVSRVAPAVVGGVSVP